MISLPLYLIETYIVMKIYRLAILKFRKDKGLSFTQCLFFLTLAFSLSHYRVFLRNISLYDLLGITLTYLAIYTLMRNVIEVALIFYFISIFMNMSGLLFPPFLTMNLNFQINSFLTIICVGVMIILYFGIPFLWQYFGNPF